MVRKGFLLFVIFFGLLIQPYGMVSIGSAKFTPPPIFATGKFKNGGYWVNIKSSGVLIRNLEITYCDNSTGYFSPVPSVGEDDWTYYDSKPMQRVEINVVNLFSEYKTEQPHYFSVAVRRNCGEEQAPLSLSCKNVTISSAIHRNTAEPVSFTSNQHVTTAGLRMPGVTGLIAVETISWNYSLRHKQNLEYNKATRIWSGTFPSLYIPVGDYKDVWLLVFDEFGQQASCKIGKLSILP